MNPNSNISAELQCCKQPKLLWDFQGVPIPTNTNESHPMDLCYLDRAVLMCISSPLPDDNFRRVRICYESVALSLASTDQWGASTRPWWPIRARVSVTVVGPHQGTGWRMSWWWVVPASCRPLCQACGSVLASESRRSAVTQWQTGDRGEEESGTRSSVETRVQSRVMITTWEPGSETCYDRASDWLV